MGRDCSDLLTVDFMSWFRTRGDEPIQAGSSQLLFPPCSILVGLVGALMARLYICTTKNHMHVVHISTDIYAEWGGEKSGHKSLRTYSFDS